MKIQVYRDGDDTPPRIFAAGEASMVCELNATDLFDIDKTLHKLRLRRTTGWEETEWGYEARLRFMKPQSSKDNGNG